MEDIKIETFKSQNSQNDFPDSDEFPPDTDSNYPYENNSSQSMTQDKEISKTTQSSKTRIISKKKIFHKRPPYKVGNIPTSNSLMQKVRGYPQYQYKEVQPKQSCRTIQQKLEYQLPQAGTEFKNIQRNEENNYVLQNEPYQVLDEGQFYQFSEKGHILPIIKSGSNQEYQYVQLGQPYEILGNNQKKMLSPPSTKNQYFQIGHNNQIVQLLTQPYEYEDNQKPNQIQIFPPQNLYKEIKNIKKPQVNYGSYDFKQNNLGAKKQAQITQKKIFKKNIQNKNMNNIYRVSNINNYNNNTSSVSLKNSIQSKPLRRKPIHQVTSAKLLGNNYLHQIISQRSEKPEDSTSKKKNILSTTTSASDFTNSFSAWSSKKKPIFNDIQRIESFKEISTKKIKYNPSLIFERKTLPQFEEIPRKQYKSYANVQTLFFDGGIDSGKYKFDETVEAIKDVQIQPTKVIVNEKDVLKEIDKRANKKKKMKLNYQVMEKYYSLTDFNLKAIYNEQIENAKKEKERIYGSNDKILENKFGQFNYKSQARTKIMTNTKSKSKPKNKNEERESFDLKSGKQKKIDNIIKVCPIDNFSKILLEKINKIRTDPQSFISVIEKAKQNIVRHTNGSFIYKGKIKVALYDGKPAFNEAIEVLKNTKPMDKLEYSPKLTVQLPLTVKEIKNKDDLRLKVEKMTENGINIKSYWRDLINDPETSLLLMIVDDNGNRRGLRRRDLLNPYNNYIGISSIEIYNKFVCYITLTTQLEK